MTNLVTPADAAARKRAEQMLEILLKRMIFRSIDDYSEGWAVDALLTFATHEAERARGEERASREIAERALWHIVHRHHDAPLTEHTFIGCRSCSQVHSLLAIATRGLRTPPSAT